MSVSNINSGIHASTQKCAMKIKERKNDGRLKYFDGRKEFIRRVRKTRVMDIKQLQVNDSSSSSSYIEGIISLAN